MTLTRRTAHCLLNTTDTSYHLTTAEQQGVCLGHLDSLFLFSAGIVACINHTVFYRELSYFLFADTVDFKCNKIKGDSLLAQLLNSINFLETSVDTNVILI